MIVQENIGICKSFFSSINLNRTIITRILISFWRNVRILRRYYNT